MKRFLPIFFVLTTYYLILTTFVRADFDRAYQDYLYQFDQYRRALTDFLTAKNRYLTYQTLTSQTEALKATKNFLSLRDQVIVVYLKMLLEKNPQESFPSLINEEITFFENHQDLLPAIGSLEDAVSVSQQVSEHFPQTEVLARQTVANILIAKVEGFQKRTADIEVGFEEKINSLKTQGKEVGTLERWLLSTKNKLLLANDKIFAAQNLTAQLTTRKTTALAEDFGKTQVLIFEANQYLKEAIAYLSEIKEELKYGNY